MKKLKMLVVLALELLALAAMLLVLALSWIVHGVCRAVLAIGKWLVKTEQALTWLGSDLNETARSWMKWAMR